MESTVLDSLYQKYNIATLSYGAIHDKLGDVYEEYCLNVLNSPDHLQYAKKGFDYSNLDFSVFKSILSTCEIQNFSEISKIEATNNIPHRETHRLSKTDVIMTVLYKNGTQSKYAISCKQSYAPKMAFAEFDVETICREVGITNNRLKSLMLKHQTEKSAKNFSNDEKQELRELLAPIANHFVRWVVTGSSEKDPTNLVFPTSIIKFKLQKPKDRYNIKVDKGELQLLSYCTHTVEEYINFIMFDKKGKRRSGGFGTGLSWTYATGSGGSKIQFKA